MITTQSEEDEDGVCLCLFEGSEGKQLWQQKDDKHLLKGG